MTFNIPDILDLLLYTYGFVHICTLVIKIVLLLIVLVFKILEILKVCWNLFCSYIGHICFGILSVLGGEGIFVFFSFS